MLWTRRTLVTAVSATLLAMTAILSGCGNPAGEQDREIIIFAAASMKSALDEAVESWEKESGKDVTISYAGSSTLAKQLEQGAPADMFISANLEWMDYLAERKLIDVRTRSNFLGNRLILVAPNSSDLTITIAPDFDLAGVLGDSRLAMANTDAVPAGMYGKTALESLGVWGAVRGKIAQAQDVRAALALVSRGEAPLGIVYQTDAAADPNVKILDTFPEETHGPIVYPIALMAASNNQEAQALLGFLTSEKAAPYFKKQGFTLFNPKD